jgi:ribosome-associated protein
MTPKSKYPKTIELAVAAIEEKMGRDVLVYDVRGKSTITDYFVVASAASPPQLKAILENINGSLKEEGIRSYRRGGDPASGWLVLDYLDVVIHLFLQETRVYYAIEELWEEKDQ